MPDLWILVFYSRPRISFNAAPGFLLKRNLWHKPIIDPTRVLTPAFTSPAKVHGNAQFALRSKFLRDHVAILNIRLESLKVDSGDVSKLLKDFVSAFFGGTDQRLLILQHIKFDLDTDTSAHKVQTNKIIKKLKLLGAPLESRCPSKRWLHLAGSGLTRVIFLITTHAEQETGNLAISSTSHVSINEVRSFLFDFQITPSWATMLRGVPEASLESRLDDFCNEACAMQLGAEPNGGARSALSVDRCSHQWGRLCYRAVWWLDYYVKFKLSY